MTQQEQLKPCPFCGGAASGDGYVYYSRPCNDTAWDDGSPITEAFFCNCPSCGISNMATGIGYRSKAEAIAAWNTRATVTVQDAAQPAPIREITDEDLANIVAHLSYECEPKGPLPNANSLMMEVVRLRNALAVSQSITVQDAARMLVAAVKAGAIDPFDCTDLAVEALAIKHAGNRRDGVGQLEIAEEFFVAALTGIAEGRA